MVSIQTAKKKRGRSSSLMWELFGMLFALAVLSVFGILFTFFMLLSPALGYAYLKQRKHILRKRGIDPPSRETGLWLRATVVGICGMATLTAPVRGLAYLLVRFLENVYGWSDPYHFFMVFSINGILDALLGIFGVAFSLVGGYLHWRQALLLKSQIVNIPTATARSATLGIAEFKGVAHQIADPAQRLTEERWNAEDKGFKWPSNSEGDKQEPIIHYYHDRHAPHGKKTVEICSRFYLQDPTGRILIDPRRAEYWDGQAQFFSFPCRNYYLKEVKNSGLIQIPGKDYYEKRENIELRQLYPGDEIYVIGSVEENPDAASNAVGVDRLVLRPSTRQEPPDLLRRLMLGDDKKQGSGMFDIFFLTDLTETEAKAMLGSGMISIWGWVIGLVALCLPLVLAYGTLLINGHALVEAFISWLHFDF